MGRRVDEQDGTGNEVRPSFWLDPDSKRHYNSSTSACDGGEPRPKWPSPRRIRSVRNEKGLIDSSVVHDVGGSIWIRRWMGNSTGCVARRVKRFVMCVKRRMPW